MKNIVLLSACLSCAATTLAQSRADYDETVGKFQNYYNHQQTDSLYYMMSDRSKTIIPLEKMRQQFTQLSAQLGDLQSYAFTKNDNNTVYYKSVFKNATLSMVLSLNNEKRLEKFTFLPYKEEAAKNDTSNIVLKTASGNIYGTLTMPDKSGKVPVVLIIVGSGPTDRDGNNTYGVKSNTYKMIADSLKNAGIACVRYDKRGIGESMGAMKDPSTLLFDNIVNDAVGYIDMLKKDPRFSKVIVLGHSEGSLVGMIACNKEKTAGYISVSGIADKANIILEKQVSIQSKELAAKAVVIMDSLSKGYDVKNIDPELTRLYDPVLQAYIRSWIKYDPQQEIKKLTIPVLLIQGTHDVQVEAEQARMLKKAKPTATLKIIDGMSHILKEGPADRDKNMATYTKPELPLMPGLMPDIIQFVNSTK